MLPKHSMCELIPYFRFQCLLQNDMTRIHPISQETEKPIRNPVVQERQKESAKRNAKQIHTAPRAPITPFHPVLQTSPVSSKP